MSVLNRVFAVPAVALVVGWAKAHGAVPTAFPQSMVGTLRFAHPTALFWGSIDA
jgi:hypothetical protein